MPYSSKVPHFGHGTRSVQVPRPRGFISVIEMVVGPLWLPGMSLPLNFPSQTFRFDLGFLPFVFDAEPLVSGSAELPSSTLILLSSTLALQAFVRTSSIIQRS